MSFFKELFGKNSEEFKSDTSLYEYKGEGEGEIESKNPDIQSNNVTFKFIQEDLKLKPGPRKMKELYVKGIDDDSLAIKNLVYLNNPEDENLSLRVNYKNINYYTNFRHIPDILKDENINLNRLTRTFLGCKKDDIVDIEYIEKRNIPVLKSVVIEITELKKNKGEKTLLDYSIAAQNIRDSFNGTIFNLDQELMTIYRGIYYRLNIKLINDTESSTGTDSSDKETFGLLGDDTNIILLGCVKVDKILKIDEISFEKLGVGGLDREFEEMFRRAFVTRTIPEKIYKKLGIQHTKGIILHGPPGCGKTRIARSLSQILNCKYLKIVNGPELKNKFVGESEKNVRDLFSDAIENKDELCMIVFDEFDALCRTRGSGGSGGEFNDSLVNQILSCIDGVNSLNNVILIGMTNRLDLIDEALLRPGRFEVHIEIGLPDEIGRYQILKIHTKTLFDNKIILDKKEDEENGVDLEFIAKYTENFTGAELEALVRDATSRALKDKIDLSNISESVKSIDENMKIKNSHFKLALESARPMFGRISDNIKEILDTGNIEKRKFDTISKELILRYFKESGNQILSILISGPSRSGKTYESARLANALGLKYTRYISAFDLMHMSDGEKSRFIAKIINDGRRSKESCIIIDDLDIIIEWTPYGFSNKMVQTIKTLLGTPLSKGSKMVIIINCTNKKSVEKTSIFERISKNFELECYTETSDEDEKEEEEKEEEKYRIKDIEEKETDEDYSDEKD